MEEDVIPGQLAIPHSSFRIEDSKFDPDKVESNNDIESKDLSDDLSLRLYETLVQVGVSEKMRLVSRQYFLTDIFAAFHVLCFKLKVNGFVCHFGSSIEGSTISKMGSDIDLINLLKGLVINDASEGIHKSTSYLIVQDEWTFPGYVKLQKVSFGKPLYNTYSKDDQSLVPDRSGRLCLKGLFVSFYRNGSLTHCDLDMYTEDWLKLIIGNYIKHGPANQASTDRIHADIVHAYECHNILNIIPRWVRRKRLFEWPSTDLLDRCSLFPTFLVRTGHPLSKEMEIEWRISFSFFERELMFSLNPTQHKCYVILKMIKIDILNQALPEEFITSYQLKTCMFWAVENTPEEIWRPEQLLQCVSICLWYLLYFVLIKNCPNYFLPTANLFERQGFLAIQSSRLNVIINSVTGLVDTICSIKCADVGHYFEGSFSKKIIEPFVFNDIIDIWQNVLAGLHMDYQVWKFMENKDMNTRILYWFSMRVKLNNMHIPSILFGSDNLAINVVKRIITLQIDLRLIYCYAVKAIATPDESERLDLIGKIMECASDFFTARLMHLTLLFKLNRLSECEEILRDIKERQNKSKIIRSYCCKCNTIRLFNEVPDFRELDFYTMFKNEITCMVFTPAEKGIVLEPLDFELNLPIDYRDNQVGRRDGHTTLNPNWCSVDGWVYYFFIRYLVYSGLNNVTMKKMCLFDILFLITNRTIVHQAVAYNIMGWIYAREGMLSEALVWWRRSLERHPHRNAVNVYCVDFFSKCVGLGKYIKHN